MDQQTFVTQVQFVGSGLSHERPQNLKEAINELVKDESGRLIDLYPILGGRGSDLIVICSFPTTQAAFKAWMGLSTRYGWKTQTNPALAIDQFQELYQQVQQLSGATSGSGVNQQTQRARA
jgi:uncharacterized protein with GYD domain